MRHPAQNLADALYAERCKAHRQMVRAALRAGGIKATEHNLRTGLQVLQNIDRIFAGDDAHRAHAAELRRVGGRAVA